MAVWIDTGVYCALVLKNYSSEKLLKINFVMPEDRAIKPDVNPCSHGQDPDRQKNSDGRTDGFSALYI